MKFTLTLCLLFSLHLVQAQTPVSPSAAATPAAAQTTDINAVIKTEKQRFAAQVSKDYAVLDKVLANDLVYTHSDGHVDTKQSFVKSIRDGKLTYKAIEAQEQKGRMYGPTAIINGKCLVKVTNNGQAINTALRYTSVYLRKGAQWQMVSWQSVKLAN